MNTPPYTAHQARLHGASYIASSDDGSLIRPDTTLVRSGSIKRVDSGAGQSILTRDARQAQEAETSSLKLSQHANTESTIRPLDNTSNYVDRSNPLNEPEILAACRFNQIAWLQELLAADPALAYRAAPSGITDEDWVYPLCVAAREGHEKAVELLLTALDRLPEGKRPGGGSIMAVINTADRWGRTLLHMAALGGHIKVVEQLLKAVVGRLPETERPAAVQRLLNATDDGGRTPLLVARQQNHEEVAVLLRDALQKPAQTARLDSIIPEAFDQPGSSKLPATQPGTSDESFEVSAQSSLPVDTLKPKATYVAPPLSYDEIHSAGLVNPTALAGETYEPMYPLHWADKNDQNEMLKWLVSIEEMDINATDMDDLTQSLHRAAKEAEIEIWKVFLLSTSGIQVNEEDDDDDGLSLLCHAAKVGHTECVKALLRVPGILVNEKDEDGSTPLCLAAKEGHTECVKALLTASGILVNAKDNHGMTPLCAAALFGHAECVKVLLRAPGILVNEKNNYGQSSLCLAAHCGHAKCVKALLSFPDIRVNEKTESGQTSLLHAAAKGQVECVKALLKTPGILVNEKDNGGSASLHFAARYGHAQCVRTLLSVSGILVNEKNSHGRSPLHCAAENGDAECLKLLIANNVVKITLLDTAWDGQTKVLEDILAILNTLNEPTKSEAIMLVLNVVDRDGKTLLCRAAQAGHEKVVALLLNASNGLAEEKKLEATKAVLSTADRFGRTPLYMAAAFGHKKIATELLAAPAKTEMPRTIAHLVNAADLFGETPVSQASSRGHCKIERLLTRASSNAGCTEGETRDTHTVVELFDGALLRLNTLPESARLTAVMAVLHHASEDVLFELDVADLESYDTLVVEILAAMRRLPAVPEDASRNNAILRLMDYLCEGGKTGFSYTCVASKGQEQVAELLKAFPILSAARNGQITIVAQMLKILETWPESERCRAVRTVLTISNKDGATPLHWAACKGHHEVVQQFLNTVNKFPEAEKIAVFGAMVGAVDTLNRTPLAAAVDNGHGEIVDQLIQGFPLMSAVLGGHNQSVEQLMKVLTALPSEKRGSAIMAVLKQIRPEGGVTPLYIAASQGNIEIMKSLLGAVTTLLTDGNRKEAREVLYSACKVKVEDVAITPLRIAAINRHDKAVELLLDAIRKLFKNYTKNDV